MLHLYLGSTQANRDSDDFRLREAYRALRVRLDTDGMLELNTAELPVRGLTPEALVGQMSTVPFPRQRAPGRGRGPDRLARRGARRRR